MGKRSLLLAMLFVFSSTLASAQALDQNGVAQQWQGSSEQHTVIDFAAAWCRPCWTVLPRLEKLAAENPEIRVIVVSVDDEVEGRDELVEKLDLTIPVIWDEGHRIAEHYRPEGMPTTLVLDPAGKLVYQHVGSASSDWEHLVEFLEATTK